MLDAAAFSNQTALACAPLATCITTPAYKTALSLVQVATQWMPACSVAGCDDATLPNTAVTVSANYAGVGTTPTTNTVARNAAGSDTNALADWVVGASSLGLANP